MQTQYSLYQTVYEGYTSSDPPFRSTPSSLDSVVVTIWTEDGTATAFEDYIPVNRVVYFGPQDLPVTLPIITIDDAIPEDTEYYTIYGQFDYEPGIGIQDTLFVKRVQITDNDTGNITTPPVVSTEVSFANSDLATLLDPVSVTENAERTANFISDLAALTAIGDTTQISTLFSSIGSALQVTFNIAHDIAVFEASEKSDEDARELHVNLSDTVLGTLFGLGGALLVGGAVGMTLGTGIGLGLGALVGTAAGAKTYIDGFQDVVRQQAGLAWDHAFDQLDNSRFSDVTQYFDSVPIDGSTINDSGIINAGQYISSGAVYWNYIHLTETSDLCYSGDSDGTTFGMNGNDLIYGNKGSDVLYGNADDDTLFGGQGADVLYGGKDSDVLYGNRNSDTLYGNISDDSIFGGQGDDIIYGGKGSDYINGNRGNDLLFGNLGADRFQISEGADVIMDFSIAQGDRLVGSLPTTVTDISGGARLAFEDGSTVDLIGVTASNIGIDIFI